jgi:hypothetical protein
MFLSNSKRQPVSTCTWWSHTERYRLSGACPMPSSTLNGQWKSYGDGCCPPFTRMPGYFLLMAIQKPWRIPLKCCDVREQSASLLILYGYSTHLECWHLTVTCCHHSLMCSLCCTVCGWVFVHHACRHMIICDEPHLLAASEMGYIWTYLTSAHNESDTLSTITSRYGNDTHLRVYTWQI